MTRFGILPVLLLLTACATSVRYAGIEEESEELDRMDPGHPPQEKMLLENFNPAVPFMHDGHAGHLGGGFFLSPYVRYDAKTRAAHTPGLLIQHYADREEEAFQEIESVTLTLPSGARLLLEARNGEGESEGGLGDFVIEALGTLNGKKAENDEPPYNERAVASISWKDLRLLADSGLVSARVVGGQRYRTFKQAHRGKYFSQYLNYFFAIVDSAGLAPGDTASLGDLHAAFDRERMERAAREDSLRQPEPPAPETQADKAALAPDGIPARPEP